MKDTVQHHEPAPSSASAQRESRESGGHLSTQLASSPRQLTQQRLIGQTIGIAVQRVEDGLEEEEGGAAQSYAEPQQRQANRTGLPDDLKAGIESLSGMDMSDVRVHRNSSQPAQLNALAYAQGNDIHLGPGQEQHLPHEAWHVVQQRQARVQATIQMAGAEINNDGSLEEEADAMGRRAVVQGAVQLREEKHDVTASTPDVWVNAALQRVPRESAVEYSRRAHSGHSAHMVAQRQLTDAVGRSPALGAQRHGLDVVQRRLTFGGHNLHGVGPAVAGHVVTAKGALGVLHGNYDAHLAMMIASGQNFPFANAVALNLFLAAAVGGANLAPRTAAQVGAALAGLGSIMLASEIVGMTVDAYLGLNAPAHVVITRADDAAFLAYYNGGINPARLARAHVCDDSEVGVTLEWLSARSNIPIIQPAGIAAWANALVGVATTGVITSNPQERGDMHDVRIALALQPGLKVLFVLPNVNRRGDAAEILPYYDGFAGRVALVSGNVHACRQAIPQALRERGVSQATEKISGAAMAGHAATEQVIEDQTCGTMTPARRAAYDIDLLNHGFAPGGQYVIINYRDSGHNVPANRAPSHPELDTGVQGFWDLVTIVQAAGFTPVPMGVPPPLPPGGVALGPATLANWWRWGSCAQGGANVGLNKRQCEYGALKRLNEFSWVRALSMRSGLTDALVFAGIETISLDLAAELYTPNALAGAQLDPTDGSSGSWRRAAKREQIRPGRFHQGFLQNARDDNGANPWPGPLDTAPPLVNTLHVAALVQQHFGTAAVPSQVHGMSMDATSPIAVPDVAADDLLASRIAVRQPIRLAALPAMNPFPYAQGQANTQRPLALTAATNARNRASQAGQRARVRINGMLQAVLGAAAPAPLAGAAFGGAVQNQVRVTLQAPIAGMQGQGAAALGLGQAARANLPGLIAGATVAHPLSPAALDAQNYLGLADGALAAAAPRHVDASLLLDHVLAKLTAAAVGAQPAHAPAHAAMATIEGHLRVAAARYAVAARAGQRVAHVAMLAQCVGDLDLIRAKAVQYMNRVPVVRNLVVMGAANNVLADSLAELDALQAAADFLGTFAVKQVEQRAQVLAEVVQGMVQL